jgi:hypothetical protein
MEIQSIQKARNDERAEIAVSGRGLKNCGNSVIILLVVLEFKITLAANPSQASWMNTLRGRLILQNLTNKLSCLGSCHYCPCF